MPLYWVVDADERAVEVWTPQAVFPRVEREQILWQPAGATAPFTLAQRELFQPL